MSSTPGWHPDPQDPQSRERWWDGQQWGTDSPTRPKGTPGQEPPNEPGVKGWWDRLSTNAKTALALGIIAVVILGLLLPEEGENVDLGGAPDVRGIALPDARQQLERANYRPSVKSQSVLGIIVEENWTVCEQDTPNGRLVPVEVARECEE